MTESFIAKRSELIELNWSVKNLPTDATIYLRETDAVGFDKNDEKVDPEGAVGYEMGEDTRTFWLEEERTSRSDRKVLGTITVTVEKE